MSITPPLHGERQCKPLVPFVVNALNGTLASHPGGISYLIALTTRDEGALLIIRKWPRYNLHSIHE